MSNTIQTISGQAILGALIDLFSQNGNEMSLQEIHLGMPEKMHRDLSESDLSAIDEVLKKYTSEKFMPGPDIFRLNPQESKEDIQNPLLFSFETMGENGFRMHSFQNVNAQEALTEAMLADPLEGPKNLFLMEPPHSQTGKPDDSVLHARIGSMGGFSYRPRAITPAAANFVFKKNACGMDTWKQTGQFCSSENSAYQQKMRQEMHQIMRQNRPARKMDPEFDGNKNAAGNTDLQIHHHTGAEESVSVHSSVQLKQPEIDLQSMEVIQSLQKELDAAYLALQSALNRAEEAEAIARQAKAESQALTAKAAALTRKISVIEHDPDGLLYSLNLYADPTVQQISKIQDEIAAKQRKIRDHQAQIERDSSKMMKSLHRSQIRAGQKSIDGKERHIARLRSDMHFQS